jgi:hypothetical protein
MPGRNFYPKEILIGGINVLVALFSLLNGSTHFHNNCVLVRISGVVQFS